MKFKNDAEMFDMMKKQLYSAVIADSLDKLGYRDHVMDARIRPIYSHAIVVGRAMTVVSIDVYNIPGDPYRLEIESIDSLKPNDVVVASTGRSTRTCYWGELLSTAAKARGARGAVIDGYTRDVRKIAEMDFPVFASGTKPVDSLGRGLVISYNVPISCGDVLVQPADVVFGDIDGVVVIPRDVEEKTIALALEKVTGEDVTRKELQKGAYLRDVFAKYGVM